MRSLTRLEAIAELRAALLRLTEEGESVCAAAGRLGVFCGGHRRLSDAELADRYDWIVLRQRPRDRAELEDLANRWQLARQSVLDQELACDVQTEERETCHGWGEFSDAALADHCRALLAEPVRIVPSTEVVRPRGR